MKINKSVICRKSQKLNFGADSQPSDTLAYHKLEVTVHSLISFAVKSKHFSFDTNDLLISTDQHGRHCIGNKSNFKNESVFTVEELESIQDRCLLLVHLNFPGLFDCFRHHVVLHRLITLLLSAHAIAPNKIVKTSLPTTAVFNSCKPKVNSPLFYKFYQHGFGWKLNFFILISRRTYFFSESQVFQVYL